VLYKKFAIRLDSKDFSLLGIAIAGQVENVGQWSFGGVQGLEVREWEGDVNGVPQARHHVQTEHRNIEIGQTVQLEVVNGTSEAESGRIKYLSVNRC